MVPPERKIMTDSAPKIIVAGDVSIDWVEASVSYKGTGAAVNWQLSSGTRLTPLRGGALLLADLIAEALPKPKAEVVTHQLPGQLELIPPNQVLHSLVQLHPSAMQGEEKSKVYRVVHMRGYAGPL